jgi:hypothetical protein
MREFTKHIKEQTNKALVWLDSLRVGNKYGRYRICGDGGVPLVASYSAVYIQNLLSKLDTLNDRERKEWVEYIQSRQDPQTGYFFEPSLKAEDDLEGMWETDYVLESMTCDAITALSILGATPIYPMEFLRPFKNKKALLDYLKGLDWREPWYQSNKVMFKLSFLIDDFERNGSSESRDYALAILDWLDSWQDPGTGLWGTDSGVSAYHGVFTAAHFLCFYFYLKRPLRYITKLIDSTLSIQNRKDGLFSPHGGGGACPDLDAVDILVKLSSLTDYRGEDVAGALEKSFYGLIYNQNDDGGFCWAKKRCFTPIEWLRSLPRIKNDYSRSKGLYPAFLDLWKTHFLSRGFPIHYAGLKSLTYFSNESDIVSTWLRLLALGLIATRYPDKFGKDIKWGFFKKAGLGWHNP